MLKVNISPEDLKTIKDLRYNHPHPGVQKRMDVLCLKGAGVSNDLICDCASITPNTMRRYFHLYNDGGIEALKKLNYYCPTSEMADHRDTLENHFKEHPVTSIPEAVAVIEKLTGISRRPTQVRKFLKEMGLVRRKVGSIPFKADPDEQEKFKKEKLEPRLEEAKAGKRVVLFVDAAHFVYSAYLGFLWCFERIFIKAPSGRNRFNVLGALNAITHEIIMVTNDQYINAQSVCDLLKQIAEQYVGIPITLVLDNARYQKCNLVMDLARSLNIELLYLPTYSPNLNIIERLWKFVKKECLYCKTYEDFSKFKESIFRLLSTANHLHKKKLSTLLALNFQTFKK